jgi:hypothetical protein
VLPPFRRRAAGQGYEKSLLFAVQFGLRAGSGALLQGSFQPLFSKSLADVPHGLGGYLEHIGNEAVGVPCGREEQDAGPSEHPGFGRSLLEETQQVRLLLIRQDHYIGLGPRHLPSLHIGFCGGKDTQRNQCGQVLARYSGFISQSPSARRQGAHTGGAAALRPYRGRGGAAHLMVFEEIIRYSPRRRALPWIAEGFSPTAQGV